MNKKLLLLFIPLVLIVVVSVSIQKRSSLQTPSISIGKIKVTVDIADNESKWSQGLSGRKELKDGTGMLFVFPSKQPVSFWMHGMLFPLDFVWIADTTVVDLTQNVPPPKDITSTNIPMYTPIVPVNRVLEVPAGFIQKNGIQKGDTVTF